jgi:hypothetical protein
LSALLALTCVLVQNGAVKAQVSTPGQPSGAKARAQTLEGTWSGTLQAGDTALHLVLHIAKGNYGSFAATVDSLDQGVYGIEVGSLQQVGSTFTFEIPSVSASFKGEISADHHAIEGTWSQGGASLPLTFHRQPHMSASKSPSGAVATAEGTWQGALETNGMRYCRDGQHRSGHQRFSSDEGDTKPVRLAPRSPRGQRRLRR